MSRLDEETGNSLVEKALAGDRKAFSTLVRRMMGQVVALTYRMTGDRESALDLAQETFVAAWQNLGSFRREASFTSWLYRIATNKTLNFLKSTSRHAFPGELEQPLRSAEATGNPEQELMKKELARGVLEFMSTLPPQQRLIFNFRFYKEMAFNEIAQITGRTVGTVKTGYREAVKKLRQHAQEKGWRS